MPVSTGRVSSRDAERATLSTVSTNAAPGTSTRSPSGSGNGGKSSERSVRMWNVAEPPTISTSCSVGRSSSVTSSPGSARTTSTTRRAGRTTEPSRTTSPFERDAQADLHVGGAQFDPALRSEHLDSGERLHGAARGRSARDGLKLSEERVAPGRDLHAAAASRVEIG